MLLKSISKLTREVSGLVFPQVCACCGQLTINRDVIICEQCLSTRFEYDELSDKIILPEKVAFRFSLWKFDKLGYLQDMLHKLKYDHLTGVGTALGREVGKQLIRSGLMEEHFSNMETLVLVPVPLFVKRHRKRGYNQARIIADGINSVTNFPVIKEGAVIRTKNTTTQTGLNSNERIKNLSSAFRINMPDLLKGKIPLIVDDVYTTGATTFEMATCLYEVTNLPSAIITIAHS